MSSVETTQHHLTQEQHEQQTPTHLVIVSSSASSMEPDMTAPVDRRHEKQPPTPTSPSIKQSSTSCSLSMMLRRIHTGYFRISLSLGAQALLWKKLSQPSKDDSDDEDTLLFHVVDLFPSTAYILLWCLSLFVLVSLSFIYLIKCILHFHQVKAEYSHNVGKNYLFAPFASWLILLQSAPILITPKTPSYLVLWWIFTVPILALDVKIYGQWFTTERKHLSLAANPTSLITLIGNLIAARAAAKMGWIEFAFFLFSLALVHYLVLYVTLYQRLAAQHRLPVMLKPVLSLFFAVPGLASLAWNSISGDYDTGSKMLFYLSLFLFAILICRPALFKKSVMKFNVAWWAFSFPLTFLAIASAECAQKVKGRIAPGLMLALSGVSVVAFLALVLFTILNITTLLREDDPLFECSKEQDDSPKESDPSNETN